MSRSHWSGVAAGAGMALLLYLSLGLSFQFSGYGEGLYDLHFVAGGWLDEGWPTPELWRPGSTVVHYYNLGLAGWGEVGSMLGLSLGATYVLGLIAFPSAVFGMVFAMAGGPVIGRALMALIATFPASGMSLWIGLGFIEIPEHIYNFAQVRVTEWPDRAGDSWVGQTLITGNAYPLESLAHLVLELQNLHPPVMGFALLTLVLLWFLKSREAALAPTNAVAGEAPVAPLESRRPWRRLWRGVRPGLLPGAALVVAYAVNAWMLPVLLGTVLGLLLLRRCPMTVLGAVVGAVLAWALLWFPYFRHFEAPDAVRLALLPAEHRSAPGSWFLIWAPFVLATAWWLGAALFGAMCHRPLRPKRSWDNLLPLVFLAAVLSLEVIHLDDSYGGTHERFNSVLKTGSVAMAGWAISLLVLASRRHWFVWLPIVLMLGLPSALQLQGLVKKLGHGAQRANWSLNEAAMLADADTRALFEGLRKEPSGITLEFTTETAYTDIPLASTLAAMPTWAGWASHLGQVDAFTPEDWRIRDRLQNWYRRFPPDNAALDANRVDFVLVRFALGWHDAQIAERRENLGTGWEWVPLTQREDGAWAGYFRRR